MCICSCLQAVRVCLLSLGSAALVYTLCTAAWNSSLFHVQKLINRRVWLLNEFAETESWNVKIYNTLFSIQNYIQSFKRCRNAILLWILLPPMLKLPTQEEIYKSYSAAFIYVCAHVARPCTVQPTVTHHASCCGAGPVGFTRSYLSVEPPLLSSCSNACHMSCFLETTKCLFAFFP